MVVRHRGCRIHFDLRLHYLGSSDTRFRRQIRDVFQLFSQGRRPDFRRCPVTFATSMTIERLVNSVNLNVFPHFEQYLKMLLPKLQVLKQYTIR